MINEDAMTEQAFLDLLSIHIGKARREVVIEIFRAIERVGIVPPQHTLGLDHYDSITGDEVMVHQPDCLLCRYLALKERYEVKER